MLSAAVSSYLLGSFPTAHLLGKWLRRIDIRKVGVRNMGTLNVFHVLGPFWAAVTFLVDAGKGASAVFLAQANGLGAQAAAFCGVLAVAGHNWPVFARFRGGKGAATGIGVVIAMGGDVVPWLAMLFGLAYLMSHNISFALGVSFVALPVLYIREGRNEAGVAMAVGMAVLMGLKLASSIADLRYAGRGNVRLLARYLIKGVPPEIVAERHALLEQASAGKAPQADPAPSSAQAEDTDPAVSP